MPLFHRSLCSTFTATAASVLLASPSLATAPEQRQDQVAGWFRTQLDQYQVTALYDGFVDLDTVLLSGLDQQEVRQRLDRLFINHENGVQTAVNAFLVHTGDHLVLVDAGSAACFGPTLGNVPENLRASGYAPEDVDTLLMTHLHPDHVCGITGSDGHAIYPNAELHISQADADYWLSEEQAAEAPSSMQGFFKMVRETIAPYQESGRLSTFQPGDPLMKGLTVIDSSGHTPGHVSFLFQDDNDAILVWGDVIHSHGVQFNDPSVAIEFDNDQQQAIASRRAIMADAADNGYWVAGAHLPFPGIGHVLRDGDGYRWLPVEYGPIRD